MLNEANTGIAELDILASRLGAGTQPPWVEAIARELEKHNRMLERLKVHAQGLENRIGRAETEALERRGELGRVEQLIDVERKALTKLCRVVLDNMR